MVLGPDSLSESSMPPVLLPYHTKRDKRPVVPSFGVKTKRLHVAIRVE